MGFSSKGVTFPPILFKLDVTELKIDAKYKAIQGTWKIGDTGDSEFGQRFDNLDAQAVDDELCLGAIVIPSDGVYDLYVTHNTGTGYGIMHFLFGGVDKGNVDAYDAAGAKDVMSKVQVALTAGLYPLNLKIADKNASATDHSCVIEAVFVIKGD